jgi:hypothetical protein
MWLLKAADQRAMPVTALAQLSALHPARRQAKRSIQWEQCSRRKAGMTS